MSGASRDGGRPQRLAARDLSALLGLATSPTREQVEAVQAPMVPHVVVAGAGSGKTQTMGLRVLWLVANGLVEPHRVLGLTFTRKAAAQLADRLRRMLRQLLRAHENRPFLGDEVVTALRTSEPTVSTYHAYAARLVGEHGLRAGVEPSTRLIREAVAWQYATRVTADYEGPADALDKGLPTVVAHVLTLAGELAEHLVEPVEVRRLCVELTARLRDLPRAPKQRGAGLPADLTKLLESLEGRLELLPLVERYIALKRERAVLDYGDQVALAARIARDDDAVGELERTRFGAVLLDEYQDTGEAQRLLLTSLFGGHPVTAVGDPRQSIYGWRGASAGNLERFPVDFAAPGQQVGTGELTRSFRNGPPVLAVANRLAERIPLRFGDTPLVPGAPREHDGQVVAALLDSVEEEARWVADRVAALRGQVPWGEIAVLARKRSAFPRIEAELRVRGVPCEVVGLGGLLLEPEVVDVVSTLTAIADPGAGNAIVRLLAGPRWRIGPRDLAALGRRASQLVLPPDLAYAPHVPVVAGDDRSLLDAVDDPGGPDAYSPEGYRRLVALRDELRLLRRWAAQPLPDLAAQAARVLCLDVELTSRPGVRPGDATANLDRLVEVAEEFAAAGEDPGLLAFLAYLDAAKDRERGLELEVGEPGADRVQLLTVHAAKGLEWDAVFVVGLVESVFPVEGRPVADWSRHAEELPFPQRGDRAELPEFDLSRAGDQKEAATAVRAFQEDCKARNLLEERRLAYVAVTRARDLLTCTGYWWDTTAKPRGPSPFLEEVREAAEESGQPAGPWAERPGDGTVNPVTAEPVAAAWPFDPLGRHRPSMQGAAEQVLEQLAAGPRPRDGSDRWSRDVDLLLMEHARRSAPPSRVVELPDTLSVSHLVQLRRDPAELARSIRRPLPARPRPLARRGTRFHLWLEQLWGQLRLLDVEELPGAADETAEPDSDLLALQHAFRASRWWGRTPDEIEFPFDMVVEGVLLRGRVDAVFVDPDGSAEVVDWKTGPPPTGAEAETVAVQLAAYRLAWHTLTGTPLPRVRAAFHYVPSGRTVRPADLLDADELAALLRAVPMVERDVG
ncbi:MAG: ATP-dependent helicase [Actinomycetota bacterium]|nr:ATP-dependent helicase [Actinomycetota bacterium]